MDNEDQIGVTIDTTQSNALSDAARWRPVAMVVSTVAILATIGLLTPLPYHGRVTTAGGDLCHTPLFACVTLTFLWAWNRLRPYNEIEPSRRWLAMAWRLAFASTAILAGSIAMEAIQASIGRSASWLDVRSNAWGIVAGSLLHVAWTIGRNIGNISSLTDGRRRAILIGGICTAMICMAISSIGPLRILVDVYRVHQDFPILASFESSEELQRWFIREGTVRLSDRHVTAGSSSGEFLLQAGDVVGPTLVEMHHDWSSMTALKFDVTIGEQVVGMQVVGMQVVGKQAADGEVTLLVQICDQIDNQRGRDTYRYSRKLRRGESAEIRIPREAIVAGPDDRPLDLTRVQFLDIQLYDTRRPTLVYLDNVRIEQLVER